MQTWIEQLSEAECVELLASSTLGRLGVIVDGRPEIFPVNHVVDSATHRVVFASNRRTKLHAALSWPWVAFEVDGESETGGWSVLVVGHAEELAQTDAFEGMSVNSGQWAAGPDSAHTELRGGVGDLRSRRVVGRIVAAARAQDEDRFRCRGSEPT